MRTIRGSLRIRVRLPWPARVISTAPGNLYDQRSGTSMATPHVTAAMALGWTGTEETRKGVAEGILKVSANIGC